LRYHIVVIGHVFAILYLFKVSVSILSIRFRRIANLYFLVMSGLMLAGTLDPRLWNSPVQPYTTFGPLVFVLMVTMVSTVSKSLSHRADFSGLLQVKEGLEDLKRHRADYETNNLKKATVVTASGENRVAWRDIKGGDVLKLGDKDEVRVET
jgi:hypothetical protein